jgi:SAM-dependent methyltransferase
MTHHDREAELQASWIANAAAWTDAVRESRIPSRAAGTDRAIVQAVLGLPGTVLDVGCGEGWLVRALTEYGRRAIGVDGSAPLIDRARERGGEFFVASYEELIENPRRVGSEFGVIALNFAVLSERPSDLFASLASLLAPRGALIIQTLHPWTAANGDYVDGWRTESFAAMEGSSFVPMPWYFRTLGSWIGVVSDAGLVVDRMEEPMHPESGKPLSLLLRCRVAR